MSSSTRVPPQQMAADFCQEKDNIENLILVESISTFAYYFAKDGYYKMYSREEFKRLIYLYLVGRYRQPITMNTVKDIIDQIKCNLINRVNDTIDSKYIAFQDKLLNIETFEFENFSNKKVVFYRIDCPTEKIKLENAPLFNAFLEEILVDSKKNYDKDLAFLVQEMFGYFLLNTLEAHTCFFLVGQGNNGKSVLISILRQMIGLQFSESMSIETLTTNRFAPSALIGKKINVCVEEESDFIKSDKFKALVSGDSEMSIEFKYGDRFQWKPTVKYIFATNKLPTYSGFNKGLLRRIKILPFNFDVPVEKRDTKLIEKLITEMGGIVAWTIQGARRLIKNGFRFTECLQSTERQKEFVSNLSSGVLFFWENYEESEEGRVFFEDMYEEYKIWCDKRGKKKQSYYSFFEDLKKINTLESGFAANSEGITSNYKKVIYKKVPNQYGQLPDFN